MKYFKASVLLLISISLLNGCGRNEIQGTVKDPSGNNVEGVEVTIEKSNMKCFTGKDGRYSIPFVPGNFILNYTKTGYATEKITLTIKQRGRFLAQTVTIRPIQKESGLYNTDEAKKVTNQSVKDSQSDNNSASGLINTLWGHMSLFVESLTTVRKPGSMPPQTGGRLKAPEAMVQAPATGGTTPEELGPPFFTKPTKLAELSKNNAVLVPGVQEQGLSLKDELEETLFKMRNGQEQKDIGLFMSCFSQSFPGLEKKRKETIRSWAVYDFNHLVFNLEEIQEADTDNHIALVTWEAQARNRNNQKMKTFNQKLKVGFVKEKGLQLVKSLEEVGKDEDE